MKIPYTQKLISPYYVNFIWKRCLRSIRFIALRIVDQRTPGQTCWSAGGVGDYQFQTNVMALVAGGGVRVGLEDNIFYDRRRAKLATNKDLISRIIDVAKMLNYIPYKASELRKKLGLVSK
jgi:uncharacterized protein (DUF849 family)